MATIPALILGYALHPAQLRRRHFTSWPSSRVVQSWDVAKGLFAAANLQTLSPIGFPITSTPPLKLHKVVKPRDQSSAGAYNNSSTASGLPPNYILTVKFATTLPSKPSDFQTSPTSPKFSQYLLDASVAVLTSLLPSVTQDSTSNSVLEGEEERKTHLLAQLNAALHTEREAMSQLSEKR